jgi:hypothetical protein
MSSTSNVQNLLVNVFRPVYTYDATTSNFTPKIEVSNVDIISGNSLAVFTAAVGDANSNMYVGSNAGNSYSNLRGCCNSVALGVGAGNLISNVSNSVYLGFNAGAGAIGSTANVVIGANTNGNGSSNIYIGTGTGSIGSSNIFIGQAIAPGNVSNQLRIGSTLAGDLSNRWIGIGGPTAPSDSLNHLDVSGNTYIFGNLGINTTPGYRTMDVNGNFRADDGIGVLDFSNGVTTSEGGFGSRTGTLSMAGGGDDQIIGPIKKGIIAVSALDTGDDTNRASAIFFAYDSNAVSTMASASNGYLVATTSNTNLKVDSTNPSAASVAYSVTYFPLP